MQITRDELRTNINNALEKAEFPESIATRVRATADTIHQIAFGVYYDYLGECGCPLTEAEVLYSDGGIADHAADENSIIRFVTQYDTSMIDYVGVDDEDGPDVHFVEVVG